MNNKQNKISIRSGSVFKVKPETVKSVDEWDEDQRRLVTKVEDNHTFQAHIVSNFGQSDERISTAAVTHKLNDYTKEEERWSVKRCTKAYKRGLKKNDFEDVDSHTRMFELRLKAEWHKAEEEI